MSDPHNPDPHRPDPMDKAYAQAEAVLDDAAARAARRARVLAAVAAAPQATPGAASPPVRRRMAWRYGGGLAAAGVAGLSLLLAIQSERPTPLAPSPTPMVATPPSPAPATPAASEAAAPETRTAPVRSKAEPGPSVAARRAAPPAAPETAEAPVAAPPPVPPPPAPAAQAAPLFAPRAYAPAPPPPARQATQPAQARLAAPAPTPTPSAAARAGQMSLNEIVVTAEKREASPVERRATLMAGSDLDRAEHLRVAAAQGLTDDVASLLSAGVPVDAADKEGETALMKAVQADAPETVALLRRRGARLDRKNHAGQTARDMAVKVGDAALDKALDKPLDPGR